MYGYNEIRFTYAKCPGLDWLNSGICRRRTSWRRGCHRIKGFSVWFVARPSRISMVLLTRYSPTYDWMWFVHGPHLVPMWVFTPASCSVFSWGRLGLDDTGFMTRSGVYYTRHDPSDLSHIYQTFNPLPPIGQKSSSDKTSQKKTLWLREQPIVCRTDFLTDCELSAASVISTSHGARHTNWQVGPTPLQRPNRRRQMVEIRVRRDDIPLVCTRISAVVSGIVRLRIVTGEHRPLIIHLHSSRLYPTYSARVPYPCAPLHTCRQRGVLGHF